MPEYSPPSVDNVNFELEQYSAPALDSVDFELGVTAKSIKVDIQTESIFSLSEIIGTYNFDVELQLSPVKTESIFSISGYTTAYTNIVCTVQPKNITNIMGIRLKSVKSVLTV